MNDFTSYLQEFLKARGWHPRSPAGLVKSVAIEAAELLEHFQWKERTVEELLSDPERLASIRHEVADVLIYLQQFCLMFGWSPEEVMKEKMKINEQRFPLSKNQSM